MYATKEEKRCSLHKVLKGEGEVVELEIKGDCSDSGRGGFYIRTMNLCRKAMKRENGIDGKEIAHTLQSHAHSAHSAPGAGVCWLVMVSCYKLTWLVIIQINLLSTAHGRQKMSLGGRRAVSPNPRAAPQDLKCFSRVGP